MELAGKRVTVMGFGRFGGGIGVTRWLVSQGADVLVTDLEGPEKLADSIAQVRGLIDAGSVSLRLGGHNVSDFTTCDLVVANPAVPRPWDNRFLRAARAAGVPVTTEIELAVRRLPDRRRVIGITGTAGKSTTSALVAHILRECGQGVRFGGNIGGSLLEGPPAAPSDWVVLELSSFMLHWLEGWSPHMAVVTNIAPNHLDWHASLEHYEASKRRLLESQQPGDAAVLADAAVSRWPLAPGVRRIIVEDAPAIELLIPGDHNRRNAAGAIAAVMALGAPGLTRERAAGAGATFTGLPHRLQLVAEAPLYAGEATVRFYNDSKSTTPEATVLAVRACRPRPTHLIAGGHDKGADLGPIAGASPGLAGLYTIGATGPVLGARAASMPGAPSAIECGTLERAVDQVFTRLSPGDTVLLSPGCASWDQFANYEQRGDLFASLVRARLAAPSSGALSARR